MEENNEEQKIDVTEMHLAPPGTESRKRKRKQKRRKSNVKPKQNKTKFWIEDCPDTVTTRHVDMGAPSLELLITRSTLTDDYRQVPCLQTTNQPKIESVTPEEASDGSVGKTESSSPRNAHLPSIGDKVTSSCDDRTDVNDLPLLAIKSVPDNINEDTDNSHVEPIRDGSLPAEGADTLEFPIVCIKRGNSAKRPMQSGTPTVEYFRPLPFGDCGDGIVNPYSTNEVENKYWSQRRRLFTRFDQGIQLDKESWYSVTPEAIANHIACHLVGSRTKVVVLDPYCGCGGNAIAFARRKEVDLVVGVDIDLSKLTKAASNAAIYQVPPEKMLLIHANGSHVMSCYKDRKLIIDGQCSGNKKGPAVKVNGFRIGDINMLPDKVDCIFLSPPWGGVDYGDVGKRNYSLQCIKIQSINEEKEYDNGEEILQYAADCLGRNGPVAYFLPKNTNGTLFGRSVLKVGYGGPVVMEQNVLNGKLKTITAYIGL
jgi:trimethylguanosine synthase